MILEEKKGFAVTVVLCVYRPLKYVSMTVHELALCRLHYIINKQHNSISS